MSINILKILGLMYNAWIKKKSTMLKRGSFRRSKDFMGTDYK